jgi:hypothetical protein
MVHSTSMNRRETRAKLLIDYLKRIDDLEEQEIDRKLLNKVLTPSRTFVRMI